VLLAASHHQARSATNHPPPHQADRTASDITQSNNEEAPFWPFSGSAQSCGVLGALLVPPLASILGAAAMAFADRLQTTHACPSCKRAISSCLAGLNDHDGLDNARFWNIAGIGGSRWPTIVCCAVPPLRGKSTACQPLAPAGSPQENAADAPH